MKIKLLFLNGIIYFVICTTMISIDNEIILIENLTANTFIYIIGICNNFLLMPITNKMFDRYRSIKMMKVSLAKKTCYYNMFFSICIGCVLMYYNFEFGIINILIYMIQIFLNLCIIGGIYMLLNLVDKKQRNWIWISVFIICTLYFVNTPFDSINFLKYPAFIDQRYLLYRVCTYSIVLYLTWVIGERNYGFKKEL